jgi:Caspase domain
MIRRALLAIGCNVYDNMQTLYGAETDAESIYNTLTLPKIGEYDLEYSRLLLSPTLNALRDTIREVLFGGEKLDTFTFFFAGHGGVKSGSFYMCVKDSRSDALSASALSLSDFFLNLSEAGPAQSNIIIDACESGGLVADLGVLLKSDMIGNAGTPGITLLATSAQNQYSGETPEGGVGTRAILNCIDGSEFIQDLTPTLDLVEIGRHVSLQLRESGNQTPVVWGLNLYGPPRFCRNPRFGLDAAAPLRHVLQAWPAASDVSVGQNYDQLWRVYASASGEWDARAFANVVTAILEPLRSTPETLVAFVDRLGAALLERAALSEDAYRPAQVGATLAGCLLRDIHQPIVTRHVEALQQTIGAVINDASGVLAEALGRDQYALMPVKGGLADLFYLPERIAKVLGWSALAGMLFPERSPEREHADQLFAQLLSLLLTQYELSIVVMSDAQAPCWAIALVRAAALELREDGERLAGLLYNSLISCEGYPADVDIAPDQVLNYLLNRHSGKLQNNLELVARPNYTTTVLLRTARLFDLEDIFDDDLWRLDGVPFAAFVPRDFGQSADRIIEGGENAVWIIGHDVFRISDLNTTWPADITRKPDSPVLATSVVMASLVYPDRVSWFLLDY